MTNIIGLLTIFIVTLAPPNIANAEISEAWFINGASSWLKTDMENDYNLILRLGTSAAFAEDIDPLTTAFFGFVSGYLGAYLDQSGFPTNFPCGIHFKNTQEVVTATAQWIHTNPDKANSLWKSHIVRSVLTEVYSCKFNFTD